MVENRVCPSTSTCVTLTRGPSTTGITMCARVRSSSNRTSAGPTVASANPWARTKAWSAATSRSRTSWRNSPFSRTPAGRVAITALSRSAVRATLPTNVIDATRTSGPSVTTNPIAGGSTARSRAPVTRAKACPSLAVEGLQLPRARLDLELVHRAAVEQGQTVPEHGLRQGAPSGEGHRVSPAGIDVHDEVDLRGVRDPAGRTGGDASLEESLAPQPLLEGAHPFAHRRLPVSVAGAEAQRRGHGLLGQPERPFQTDLREPDRYPGGQDDRDVLRRLSGDGLGLDLDPSVEIALAAVEREEVLTGAGEPLRGCLLADRKGCRRDELTEVEPRVALPDDPAHERPRRQVVAQADALRRIDLLDEDVREESERPQPLEALPHGMPRARAADHLADRAPDERLGDRGGGDEVDRRDDRPRTVLRLGGARPGRGHEPERRREGDGRASARPHRNRRRRTTPAA